ncbi:hypothetical protein ZWY2020_002471 [Hordeum vulgare]|nr:hypothetical protein ZWY2020_002471 [Hordeum vulgare]
MVARPNPSQRGACAAAMSTDSDTSSHDGSSSFRKITSYRECLPLPPLCLFWLWRNDVSTVSLSVLEDLVQAIELWLRIARSRCLWWTPPTSIAACIDIGDSILEAVDEAGNKKLVWVHIQAANHECREKLWAQFDASTGKTVWVDEKIRITVPEDRYGLYAIDTLDPDLAVKTKIIVELYVSSDGFTLVLSHSILQ